MWNKIQRLRNINNTLYIYATQSGILLITSDLKYYYYSVFLDMEPKALGLFTVEYPKTFERCVKLATQLNSSTNYGATMVSDVNVFNALKSFEAENPEETTESFDIRYDLYQAMCNRLLKFTTNSAEHKPYTRHICIDTKDFMASLAATDCKTLCVFGEIPIATDKTDAVKYIISKEMAASVMNIDAGSTQIVTFSKMRKSPEGEYRIQAMSGDYLFVEKQGIHIYPNYAEVINYYLNNSSLSFKHIEVAQSKSFIFEQIATRELSDQKLAKLVDVIKMVTGDDLYEDANAENTYFDMDFITRLFTNIFAYSYTMTTGTNKEMMQISCRWGKEEKYTQHLCVMPVNPEFIQAKEKSPTNSDEPISSCNLKTIKTVI